MTAHFSGAVRVGGYDHSPAALLSAEPVSGLYRESTYFIAHVLDADGHVYSAMRR